jgi:glycosyltransferase involved in cell wall biosynthesis
VKSTFIVWARYHRRAELLAGHLGATIHFIYWKWSRSLLAAPLRYLVQARQTWNTLQRERPGVIFVQNPPIFNVLIASLYARRNGARYVIDSHTGAFLSWKWRWSLGLHRMLSRQALTTLVHNKCQEEILKQWGCHYLVVGFTPGHYPAGIPFTGNGQFMVAVICGFNDDEPVEVVFEAASRLPEVSFYVTGDSSRITPRMMAQKPDNCKLTGYLPYERYVGLLQGADAILVLTSQNQTLLMGAFEAVSLGTPLIVSDWPVLRDYFSLGTVYVPNTAQGICEGVFRAQREGPGLQRDILRLRHQLRNQWEMQFAALQRLLHER